MEIKTPYETYLQLEGHLDDIYFFAEKENAIETHISERGRSGATKYFLIPRKLRKGLRFDGNVSCKRIDDENKVFFIYSVEKLSSAKTVKQVIRVKT